MKEASEKDVRIFESAAGHVLDLLGYGRLYVKSGEEVQFTEADIAAFDAENTRLKEEYKKLVDPEDRMRRELQADLLKEIRARHAGRTPQVAVLVKQQEKEIQRKDFHQ